MAMWLRNVGKAVKGLLEGDKEGKEGKEAKEARRKQRQEVVKEAAMFQGADRAEIPRRRGEFVAKWQESEPDAVATLLRDFEQTMVYVEAQAAAASRGERWDARYLRTASALERLKMVCSSTTLSIQHRKSL